MTDPRDLIKAATPLPWIVERYDDNGTDSLVIRAPNVHEKPWEAQYGRFILRYFKRYNEGDKSALARQSDLDLLIYAVNSLPAYLDVAEALERLMTMFDGNIVGNALVMHASDCMTEAEGLIDGTISCTCGADEPLLNAETALARLRENQP